MMVTFDLKTKYASYAGCNIEAGHYPKFSPGEPDQVGWRILKDGEPIITPTVNLSESGQFPAAGCVFIRTADQYTGILESLCTAGILVETGRVVSAGFVERYATECRVLHSDLMVVDQV